jgi:nucleoid DNA-binding protein
MEIKKLAARIAERATMAGKPVHYLDAETVVQILFDPEQGVIIEFLEREKELQIPRFGKFKIHQRPEREGRDPRTGETVILRPKKTVKFKGSVTLEKILSK